MPSSKEYMKEYNKQYYLLHKHAIKISTKEYREQNKKFYRQYRVEYRKKHPLRWKAYKHKRRNLIKGLTLETIQRVYEDSIEEWGTLTCYLCLKPIKVGKDSLEHKTPLSRGGTNRYSNLGVAHSKCNDKKGTKTVEEWMR